MHDGPEWFAPKRYGMGAGPPITWQGWAVTIGYMAAMILGATLLAPHRPLAFAALAVPVTLVFIWITARTTRGGWHWRWGGKE